MRTSFIFAAVAALSLTATANASELLITSGAAKSGASAAVDFVSDGNATGLQINMNIPAGGKIDTSGFARNLPKGFSALTNVVGDEFIALIVNDTNATLPKGVVSLGVIRSQGGRGAFSLLSLEAVDVEAKPIRVKTVSTDANK